MRGHRSSAAVSPPPPPPSPPPPPYAIGDALKTALMIGQFGAMLEGLSFIASKGQESATLLALSAAVYTAVFGLMFRKRAWNARHPQASLSALAVLLVVVGVAFTWTCLVLPLARISPDSETLPFWSWDVQREMWFGAGCGAVFVTAVAAAFACIGVVRRWE